jgi:hypothetical protein
MGLAAMAPQLLRFAGERESGQGKRQSGKDEERLLGLADLEA